MPSNRSEKRKATRLKKVKKRILRAAGDMKKIVRRKQKVRLKKGARG
jgi:hypothetical protein